MNALFVNAFLLALWREDTIELKLFVSAYDKSAARLTDDALGLLFSLFFWIHRPDANSHSDSHLVWICLLPIVFNLHKKYISRARKSLEENVLKCLVLPLGIQELLQIVDRDALFNLPLEFLKQFSWKKYFVAIVETVFKSTIKNLNLHYEFLQTVPYNFHDVIKCQERIMILTNTLQILVKGFWWILMYESFHKFYEFWPWKVWLLAYNLLEEVDRRVEAEAAQLVNHNFSLDSSVNRFLMRFNADCQEWFINRLEFQQFLSVEFSFN